MCQAGMHIAFKKVKPPFPILATWNQLFFPLKLLSLIYVVFHRVLYPPLISEDQRPAFNIVFELSPSTFTEGLFRSILTIDLRGQIWSNGPKQSAKPQISFQCISSAKGIFPLFLCIFLHFRLCNYNVIPSHYLITIAPNFLSLRISMAIT